MENKNSIIMGIGLIFASFVVALAIFNINDYNAENDLTITQNLKMHEQYAGLPEDNRFIEETGSQIVNRFENGSGVIFLGFKECPWCQKAAPLINEAAEAEDTVVYYLDIQQERDASPLIYQELIGILSPHLKKDEDGAPVVSTPDISIVKDGEMVWRYELEAMTEDERTPETYWTIERQERAVADFREEMRKLKLS